MNHQISNSLEPQAFAGSPKVLPEAKPCLRYCYRDFPVLPSSPTFFDDLRLLDAVAEDYEERAAILEYDAGMSREDAEEEARRITGYEGW